MHELPDRIIVWNELQRAEAVDLHGARPDQVTVTGAQAYDHWFTTRPGTTRDAFCAHVGLPPGRPYLLYLVLVAVHRTARSRSSTAMDSCHPGQPVRTPQHHRYSRAAPSAERRAMGRRRSIGVRRYGDLSSRRRQSDRLDARSEYYDSMYHSHAVVGVNTSALIESGIIGRLVYSFRVPELSGTQEGTLHFRHLKREGLLQLADTLDEHVTQVEHSFQSAEADQQRVRRVHAAVRAAVRVRRAGDAARRPRHRGRGTTAMKILFLMDSPEYLRFYDSRDSGARGTRP
jgi:hypothetical protein